MTSQAVQKRFIASGSGQHQMCRDAAEKNARADQTFLHLVESGMTKQDLRRCIALRPTIWQRYEHWLEKLPEERKR